MGILFFWIYARHFEKNLNNKKRLDETIANIIKVYKIKICAFQILYTIGIVRTVSLDVLEEAHSRSSRGY